MKQKHQNGFSKQFYKYKKQKSMNTKMKALLLSSLLLIFTGLKAQDKWEYSVVRYSYLTKSLSISQFGAQYEKIEIPKEQVRDIYDYTFLLNHIQKMVDLGWEVYSNSEGTYNGQTIVTYYLRKKK